MKRSYVSELKAGKSVLLKGWVYNNRELGKVKFLLVKDMTGVIQVTAHKDKVDAETFKLMTSLPRESVISVEGRVVANKKAPRGIEISPKKIEVIAMAEYPLPIDVSDFSKTEISKRLDYRFLDFHSRRTQAIFKIQTEIINAFRNYFYDKGFLEMQPPGIISSASEGGTDLFEIKYFEKNAYLAQSPQLYKQMVACSIGETFATSPIWRAEKHNTTKHINEIRQLDIEMPFVGQLEIMKEQEGVLKYIIGRVIKKYKPELELLKVKLKPPKTKYLSYDETLEVLEKKGLKISQGEDLSPEAERKLNEIFPDTIVFVHSWPLSLKPFYIMPKDGKLNAKLSEGFDAIYNGLEISSGGQRIHIPKLLIERIKAANLNPKNFKYYIDSFRYGAPPHGGWSIGLERLTQAILSLENIREGTLFPRDRDRLTP